MWKNVTEDWKGRGAVEPRTNALVTLSCLITLSLVLKFTPGRKVTRLPTTRRDMLQGQVFTQISWIRVPKREYYFGDLSNGPLIYYYFITGLSHAVRRMPFSEQLSTSSPLFSYLSHYTMELNASISDGIIRESFADNGQRTTAQKGITPNRARTEELSP